VGMFGEEHRSCGNEHGDDAVDEAECHHSGAKQPEDNNAEARSTVKSFNFRAR